MMIGSRVFFMNNQSGKIIQFPIPPNGHPPVRHLHLVRDEQWCWVDWVSKIVYWVLMAVFAFFVIQIFN